MTIMEEQLSTSPTTVDSMLLSRVNSRVNFTNFKAINDKEESSCFISLSEFIDELPNAIHERKAKHADGDAKRDYRTSLQMGAGR